LRLRRAFDPERFARVVTAITSEPIEKGSLHILTLLVQLAGA
jgi:hypothetical protein